jgi:ribonuclease P protein subunit POP4
METKKLAQDEFIGLQVKISECSDPEWVGKSGLIIDETKNTFTIKVDNQNKMIAKKTATFEFDFDGKKIAIDGKKIAYRPEDRIKKVR